MNVCPICKKPDPSTQDWPNGFYSCMLCYHAMTKQAKIECSTCKHFRYPDEDIKGGDRIDTSVGFCHRYAPAPLSGGSGTGWTDWEWPAISPADFCGEHSRKE
jgi:hypothetical protein